MLTPTEDESADGETTLDVNGMSPDYAAKNIALWANVTTARTFRSPSLLILAFPKTAVLLPPFLPFNGQKCVETQSASRPFDKQVIADGTLSIVAKRRRQPRLATNVCFSTGGGGR